MTFCRSGLSLAWLTLLFASEPVLAHDFWIAPSSYQVAAGDLVQVSLRVGDRFRGSPVARDPDRIVRFVLAGPGGEDRVRGIDGSDPAGFARPKATGLQVIGYRSNNAFLEMEAESFERYLREEGLEAVLALRAQRGERRTPGREAYSRCAKSLIQVGDRADEGHDRILGLTLEIVPDRSPYAMKPGERLPVRILHRGRPFPRARVRARHESAPDAVLEARTDEQGRAELRPDRAGVWLLTALAMEPAPAGVEADWQSVWASLTFRIPTDRGEDGAPGKR